MTIANTYFAYPRRVGQDELAWVVNYIPKWCKHDSNLLMVTHFGTNQDTIQGNYVDQDQHASTMPYHHQREHKFSKYATKTQ